MADVAGERALTTTETLALDSKLDDAKANSGNLIAGGVPSGNRGIYTDPKASCSSGENYILTNEGYECTPLIRIGAQAGNPQ